MVNRQVHRRAVQPTVVAASSQPSHSMPNTLLRAGAFVSALTSPLAQSNSNDSSNLNMDALCIEMTGNDKPVSPPKQQKLKGEKKKLESEAEILGLCDWIQSEKSDFLPETLGLVQQVKELMKVEDSAKVPKNLSKQFFAIFQSSIENQEKRLTERLDEINPDKKNRGPEEELRRMKRTLGFVAARLLMKVDPWRKSSLDMAAMTVSELKRREKEDAAAQQKRLAKIIGPLSEAIKKDEKEVEQHRESFSELHKLGFIFPEDLKPEALIPQMKAQLNSMKTFLQENKDSKAAVAMSEQIEKMLGMKEKDNDWAHADQMRGLTRKGMELCQELQTAKMAERMAAKKKKESVKKEAATKNDDKKNDEKKK